MGIKTIIFCGLSMFGSCAWPIDWWQTADQKAYHWFQKKQYGKAAELFNDPAWQAASYYKNKDYQEAVQLLSHPKNCPGLV